MILKRIINAPAYLPPLDDTFLILGGKSYGICKEFAKKLHFIF